MLLNSVHGNKKSRKTTKLYWPLEAQERGRAGLTNSGCDCLSSGAWIGFVGETGPRNQKKSARQLRSRLTTPLFVFLLVNLQVALPVVWFLEPAGHAKVKLVNRFRFIAN